MSSPPDSPPRAKLGRSIGLLAGVCLLAGFGLGVLTVQLWLYGDEGDRKDPAAAYVEKMADRYSLDRDQKRLVWMIYTQRMEEESRYTRRQMVSLPDHARDELEAIANRADQRILAVLQPQQRTRFVADQADTDNR